MRRSGSKPRQIQPLCSKGELEMFEIMYIDFGSEDRCPITLEEWLFIGHPSYYVAYCV